MLFVYFLQRVSAFWLACYSAALVSGYTKDTVSFYIHIRHDIETSYGTRSPLFWPLQVSSKYRGSAYVNSCTAHLSSSTMNCKVFDLLLATILIVLGR